MTDSKTASSYSAVGGARIGWVNYGWPLAKLSARASSLTISTTFFGLFEIGRYSFRPDQITQLESAGWLPIRGGGIRVRHTVANYPEKIIFWCRVSAVLPGIASTGFPTVSESAASVSPNISRGFPLGILPLVIVGLLWNLLLSYEIFSPAFPGPYTLAALSLLMVTSLAILFSPAVQAVFLCPGRKIGEVRPVFVLLAAISGTMTVVFTTIFLAGGFRRGQRQIKTVQATDENIVVSIFSLTPTSLPQSAPSLKPGAG